MDVLFPKPRESSSMPLPLDAAEAYNEFMAPLYPLPNILLSQDHHPLRASADPLLRELLIERLPVYIPVVRRIIDSQLDQLVKSNQTSLRLYTFFKALTERIVTTIILGPLEESDYVNLRKLCSQHFNGIVAAPVHVEAFGARSARAAAVHAYNELTDILRRRLVDSVGEKGTKSECVLAIIADRIRQDGVTDEQVNEFGQLLIVLLSTAVPKALASAISSGIRVMSRKGHTHLQQAVLQEAESGKTECIDGVIMETLRMFPPLPGGMRHSNGACIGGLDIPKRWRVWYSALHSNRDEQAYEKAGEFVPERWRGARTESVGCPFARPGEGESVPIPLSFGAGERHCKGRDVAWAIMRECVLGVLQKYEVRSERDGESEMRFIPVMRPSGDESVQVRRR